jgi:[ribosomal protein S18]-alanine N-acetyltransferase
MVGYAEKRKLGQKPKDLLRNRRRSAAWYESVAREGIVAGEPGARLIARVEATDAIVEYEFADADSLRQRFPELWQRLEPRLRDAGATRKALLDYEDPQKRRWIEPVLVGQLFRADRPYVVLERARGAPSASSRNVTVRSAADSDYGEILALLRAEAFSEVTEPDALRDELSRSIWTGVVEARGKVTGFAHLVEIDGIAYVEDLVVSEVHRGKGYGDALLLAALNWVDEKHPGPVRLYTDFERTAAMGLYKKHGFRQLHAGVTFERPMDQKEIDEILSRRKNTYSRWVGFR